MAFLSDRRIQEALPAGVTLPFSGTAIPDGWLLCDGSVVSQTTYAKLYAALGSTYNTGGEGAGNFRLPDLRGRTVAGKDVQVSGTYANRITSGGAGINSQNLGASGGGETHAITSAQMPGHSHTGSGTLGSTYGQPYLDWVNNAGGSSLGMTKTTTTASGAANPITVASITTNISGNGGVAGNGSAHQNTQPTIVLNYIVKI